MGRGQYVLGVDDATAAVEASLVQQQSDPRILVHLGFYAADDPVLLVCHSAVYKKKKKIVRKKC